VPDVVAAFDDLVYWGEWQSAQQDRTRVGWQPWPTTPRFILRQLDGGLAEVVQNPEATGATKVGSYCRYCESSSRNAAAATVRAAGLVCPSDPESDDLRTKEGADRSTGVAPGTMRLYLSMSMPLAGSASPYMYSTVILQNRLRTCWSRRQHREKLCI
jgi:hypothetical protein